MLVFIFGVENLKNRIFVLTFGCAQGLHLLISFFIGGSNYLSYLLVFLSFFIVFVRALRNFKILISGVSLINNFHGRYVGVQSYVYESRASGLWLYLPIFMFGVVILIN